MKSTSPMHSPYGSFEQFDFKDFEVHSIEQKQASDDDEHLGIQTLNQLRVGLPTRTRH